jgi:hypothetical protein
VFLGNLLAALAGVVLGLARRRMRGMKIAFGPPLIAATLLVVLLAAPVAIA